MNDTAEKNPLSPPVDVGVGVDVAAPDGWDCTKQHISVSMAAELIESKAFGERCGSEECRLTRLLMWVWVLLPL